MINRVLQLNISQLENLFNSLLEKHFVLNLPKQSKPNPICDRSGKLVETERVFVVRGKSPVHKRSTINVCIKNLALQIER